MFGSRILVLNDGFSLALELAKLYPEKTIVGTYLQHESDMMRIDPKAFTLLRELRKDCPNASAMFEIDATDLPAERLRPMLFTDIVYCHLPNQDGSSKKSNRKPLQLVFQSVARLFEEGGDKFHLAFVPRAPSGGPEGQYASKRVYWVRNDLPELGKDIEELLHMGAEQAMAVSSVEVFKPEQFPAFQGHLNGHFTVAARRKHYHWERFTFVKAYTRVEEGRFVVSHAKKLERFGAAYHLHHYDQIGRETPAFHAYRPYYVQKLTIQFDDFVYAATDLDRVEATIIKIIKQIAGSLVVSVLRMKKGKKSTFGRGPKKPNVPHLSRSYRLYWQGVAVPMSEQLASDFQEGMVHELSLSFMKRCGCLFGCRVVSPHVPQRKELTGEEGWKR